MHVANFPGVLLRCSFTISQVVFLRADAHVISEASWAAKMFEAVEVGVFQVVISTPPRSSLSRVCWATVTPCWTSLRFLCSTVMGFALHFMDFPGKLGLWLVHAGGGHRLLCVRGYACVPGMADF